MKPVTVVLCPPENIEPTYQIMIYPGRNQTGFSILDPRARVHRFPDALFRELDHVSRAHLRVLIPGELAFHNLAHAWVRNQDMRAWDLVTAPAPKGYWISSSPFPEHWQGIPL